MDRAEQTRNQRGEQEGGAAQQEGKTPGRGRGNEVEGASAADGGDHATAPQGTATGSSASAGPWRPDDRMMGALGLGGNPAPAAAAAPAPAPTSSVAPTASAGGGAGGGAAIDPAVVAAMGLGGGAGGGGDLEGITTPPKGQAKGRVTPDHAKQLETKKKVIEKAPAAAAAAGGAGPATTGAGPATGGGTGGTAVQQTQPQQGEAPPASGGSAAPPPALQASSADGTVEGMIHTLENDRDPGARKRAAEALGKLRAQKARAALEKALRDPDPGVAAAANAALRQL